MLTEDGSHTIYLPEIDEHYHSVHGAIQESMHIYIEQGLLKTNQKEISILEIGFGTGLNAFLTYCFSHSMNLSINYLALEKYPLNETEYSQLNYPVQVFQEYRLFFEQLHQAKWNTWVEIAPGFRIQKLGADLLTFQFDPLLQFDLVYYDAFAPGKQPEMWTDEVIQKISLAVKNGGLLLTYCAKGSVRRALTSSGFQMERLPGPAGKKEILRGKKAK